MINFEGFLILILVGISVSIIGAFALLFVFILEKRFDLLKSTNKKIELEREIQRTKYYQLTQQIQPHFLFNTLNVILSLARLQRTAELVRALEELSLFLKFKYKTSETLISLAQEIEYTKHYLEIQKIRFGARLSVTITCPVDLLDAYIPPFILQTLVENAFKHGLERVPGEAVLDIHFFIQNQCIILKVTNNGPTSELRTSSQEKSGYGLKNIQRRLNLYFENHAASLTIIRLQDNRTEVAVKWPLLFSQNGKRCSNERSAGG